MRWGARPGDAAGDAVGDAAIGRGGGTVASTHNPSAAILSLSSCEDCEAQCSFPALPHPLTPCLPGHPETVSEEFNGGPLVINPLPAGSSTSFSVNVGI